MEARAQRKEAKLVNKAAKAAMHGNVAKATKLQMRANEMHAQAEFAHETREGALTVMAGSSVSGVQKLGSFVAQPRQRCCGRFQVSGYFHGWQRNWLRNLLLMFIIYNMLLYTQVRAGTHTHIHASTHACIRARM